MLPLDPLTIELSVGRIYWTLVCGQMAVTLSAPVRLRLTALMNRGEDLRRNGSFITFAMKTHTFV